jgi:methylmalonyl-CoA mutase
MSEKIYVIPPHRTRYLSEIAESNRHWWNGFDQEQVEIIWCFQNNRNSFRKVPVITKSGIDDASVLPLLLNLKRRSCRR